MRDEIDDALLHERLQAGAFEVTPATEESMIQLRAMVARAGQEAEVKPRRLGLIISSSLVAALLLGGATIPGMVNVFQQSSNVKVPLFDHEYTLPSGANCEATFGVYANADADLVETIRQEVAVSPLVDDADIDAVIADMRANPDFTVTEAGTRERVGYGTKYYNADQEYTDAVGQAVKDLLQEELLRRGMPADALGLDSWGVDACPGAEW